MIIANGEQCSNSLLNSLLAKNPFVIVLDGALLPTLERKIKIDLLMGDFDHYRVNEAMELLSPETEILHTPDQELTDLDKGIELAIQRGFKEIDIVCATGRRADHTITNITNMARYAPQARLCMYDDYSTIYPVGKGFRKEFKAGTSISLIPVGTVKGIITGNLKYPLVMEDLVLGYRAGSSNEVVKNGFVEITYQTGQLIIMECVDKD